MKIRELMNLGIPRGETMRLAKDTIARIAKTSKGKMGKGALRETIRRIVESPNEFTKDENFGQLAASLLATQKARARYEHRQAPAPYQQWGSNLEPDSVQQMENACKLPISVVGALMPDAHVGYGLPIGGVLGTKDAVIPFAVGVDIACRMKMTVLELPVSALTGQTDRLKKALESEARFGVGVTFRKRREHAVMDEDWSFSPIVKQHKDKAWSQLGTSGSGNHFVEYGTLTLEKDDLGLQAGTYLALLSHSGSRGTGNGIATHYSKIAMENHPELPRELTHLAWLDMDNSDGQEYFQAMELMGRYAAANHQLIHYHIAKHLGVDVMLDIENHHNFAWREQHYGQELVVHRKGATPAGKGTLGIIPGSMGTPGYIVRGKGKPESLNSASHGAGRRMSRRKAKETFTWSDAKKYLDQKGIILISAGLDEVPMAYKDIDMVMASQNDLVEPIARFDPKIVKMAPAGEKPED
ncbi:MAG: RtcB family protein [Desulfobulbaceae bacterium]|nr:RtcB family protein [Desulfobulbaceae bacterium]